MSKEAGIKAFATRFYFATQKEQTVINTNNPKLFVQFCKRYELNFQQILPNVFHIN